MDWGEVGVIVALVVGVPTAIWAGRAAYFSKRESQRAEAQRALRPELRLFFPNFETTHVLTLVPGSGQAFLNTPVTVQNTGTRDATNVRVMLFIPDTFVPFQVGNYHAAAASRTQAHASGIFYFDAAQAEPGYFYDSVPFGPPVLITVPVDVARLQALAPPGLYQLRYRLFCSETGAAAFDGQLTLSVEQAAP